jgi:hypothetical protein
VLITAAAGSDVFACEAYTYEQPVRYHLDYRTLREHSDQLATNQLIVTHMGPSMLNGSTKSTTPRQRRPRPPNLTARWGCWRATSDG